MAVPIYFNHNVPRAISAGLRRRGVTTITAYEDGTHTLPDPDLLDRATAMGYVLYSQDDDLLAEGHRRQRLGLTFAGIVFPHKLRSPVGRCIYDLELIAKTLDPANMMNRIEFIPF